MDGYNAQGEDQALHIRLGSVEHREIVQSGAIAKLSEESASFRASFYAFRDEVRIGNERRDKLLEAIAAAVGAI